ncbi:unnamed protein product, partial [Plutella xylostella]
MCEDLYDNDILMGVIYTSASLTDNGPPYSVHFLNSSPSGGLASTLSLPTWSQLVLSTVP